MPDSANVAFRSRISLPLLFLIATAFGISSTIQAYLLVLVGGEQPILWHVALLNTVYWYVPALMAPVIMELATRFQVGRGGWRVAIPVHIAGAFTYSIVHTAAMFGARIALMNGEPPSRGWWWAAQTEYLKQLDWLLMTYLFLVGLAHALAYRKESEEQALDSAHLQTRLVEARLQALQRQLHPHFLFNTLNAIAGLMRTDVESADRMIDRLGELLRMTLNSSHVQEIPLRDDLEMLQKYLDIEQARFGPRLEVTMDIAPDTVDAMVPNFLLQPLVENAVRHGIAPHARPGHIAVNTERDGLQLVLRIVDSGDGVQPHRLTLLNQGVGLANTRTRLQYLYRDNYSFRFDNIEGGFEVRIGIPFAQATTRLAPLTAGAA